MCFKFMKAGKWTFTDLKVILNGPHRLRKKWD